MIIVVIEGLSLVGKTTVCEKLINHYKATGKRCILCKHGHLSIDAEVDEYYRNAIQAYNRWDIPSAIEWSFLSLERDYNQFLLDGGFSQNWDIVFLDRHFTSQHVVAEYFNISYPLKFQRPSSHYYEFLLTSEYKALLNRARVRQDNHSRLTDYTLSSEKTHNSFDTLYKKTILKNNPETHILDNNDFTASRSLVNRINLLLAKEEQK